MKPTASRVTSTALQFVDVLGLGFALAAVDALLGRNPGAWSADPAGVAGALVWLSLACTSVFVVLAASPISASNTSNGTYLMSGSRPNKLATTSQQPFRLIA